MFKMGFSTFMAVVLCTLVSGAQSGLPSSVNIVSGVPLTLPTRALEAMGIKPHENTGGWGDVMSNVAMALDIKKQFPEIQVRLIVALNDQDSRPFVNKVRDFIPKIMLDDRGQSYLDPDSKKIQYYKDVEIYFASAEDGVATKSPETLTPAQTKAVIDSVAHIPEADMGIQYSANNSPYSHLFVKAKEMHLYFEEYSHQAESLIYTFFQSGRKMIKLHAGPLGFGVYGFGSKEDSRGSFINKRYIQNWLDQMAATYPSLKKFGLKVGHFGLAYGYAADIPMIEDYVQSIKNLSYEKTQPTVIVYKGQGAVIVQGQQIFIPLGAHPKELAHALIAESTYSPLVTGDGSLSSALETMSKTKSFLYEGVEWKLSAMGTLLGKVFSMHPELAAEAREVIVPLTKDLGSSRMSREDRIQKMQSLIENVQIHTQWYSYFARKKQALNLADNTINLFQFAGLYEALRLGFEKGYTFSRDYLEWLTELVKTFTVRDGLPIKRLHAELGHKVYGKSENLVEKWYALYTLWETGVSVLAADVARTIDETAQFINQKETEANSENKAKIFSILEQVNSSTKSKYAIYDVIQKDRRAYRKFNIVRKKYNLASSEPFKWPRAVNACQKFYMH
ncbi:MAG: hypothetical protein JNL11_01255 [Bdellovibrionaceae bacterium]|nr:hypothetical protein [Pseudobdellovibrionaceae bacterium]